MTAHLTDHHGAIDPRAFDADRPVRPSLAYDLATNQAERRLWGSTSYVPGQGNRRMVAIGWNSSEDGVHLQADYVFTEDGATYVATEYVEL